jgi:Putative binding domain, N-terminal/Viral BACON domain
MISFKQSWFRLQAGVTLVAAACLPTACGSSSSQTQTVTAPSATRCALQVTTESSAFPPDGGSAALHISATRECGWSAKSEAAWVTLSSPADGQGEGTVRFTVVSNAEPSSRSASLSVNDQRVEISQQGRPCQLTISSSQETVDGTGGDLSIDVRASAAQCGWTAAANVPWITIVSGREGHGNGTVNFHVDAVTGPPRTGTLSIAGHSVQVDQGTGCSYAIGTNSFSVEASGGDRQVAVTAPAGCAWTAESGTSWLTITSGTTGSGSGSVVFRVAATDGPPRTGTLTVAGRTVTVAQSLGCQFTVSPTSLNVGSSGGTGTIQVQTAPGCAWSSASGEAWISLAGGSSGSGAGQVQLALGANVGPARNGSVTIAGQAVQIAQASGCTYSVTSSTQNVPGAGASGTASITTAGGCRWTAGSGVDWISVSPQSGNGPAQVLYTIAPNLSPARSGTITIAGHPFTVTQASQCSYTLLPPFHQFGPAGGFGSILVIVSGPCSWTTVSNADWIELRAGASGVGNGLVQFVAAPNPGGARTGTLTIAGQTYNVNEGGR